MQPGDRDVQPEDGDHDDVVDDRRPHRRGEAAARVEYRADQRAHPVEEDLRNEEKREDDRQVHGGGGPVIVLPL